MADDTEVITRPDETLTQPAPQGQELPAGGAESSFTPPDPISLDALRARVTEAERMMGVYRQRGIETSEKMMQAGEAQAAQMQKSMQERQPMMDRLQQQLQQPALTPEQTANLQRPMQQMQPPDNPVVDHEEFKKFFGMAWVMSMVLGKIAGADMTDGLNMLSSAINGYVTGSKERAAHDSQQFKLKMEAALNNRRDELERYHLIFQARNQDIQSTMNALKIEAMRADDQQMLFAIQQNNYQLALKYYEKQLEQLGKVVQGAQTIWKQLDQHQKSIDLQKMRSADKEAAQTKLDDYRSARLKQIDRGLVQKDEAEQNKLMGSYEKTYSSIVQHFDSAIRQALLRAGGNQQIMQAVIEEESQWAASQMRTLNQEIEGVTFGGGRHLVIANQHDRELIETPEYWKASAQGFAKIRDFVPPMLSAPQQPQTQYGPGGTVENPNVSGEEWVEH